MYLSPLRKKLRTQGPCFTNLDFKTSDIVLISVNPTPVSQMCLDILSKFSCTPSHNSEFTLWETQQCSSAISNSRYQIRNILCPAADRDTHVDMRTHNKGKLCPACARAHAEKYNCEIELAREDLRKQREFAKEMQQKRVARQPEERAKKDQHEGQRKVSRKQGPRKLNAPIRMQPSPPRESPSQAVARRYVNRELYREEGEIREEGYRSRAGHQSQERHSSQARHSSQTDLARRIENARQLEHTKEGEHRRPTQDAKQRVISEKENESDRIQKQLEQEYTAEETRRRIESLKESYRSR
ncbi:hypothetical protein BHYA_0124g00020 [Botrytis hyacinthi]|uniref:Uncharacterized protein n=1 Tax=Botrytis hyacinthi TaxID=278943 RepID=A0A4Z1GPF3_9HELO|nr:hypothetical protein BHYA_0124g00020 [Botrytis hyacinthi]